MLKDMCPKCYFRRGDTGCMDGERIMGVCAEGHMSQVPL